MQRSAHTNAKLEHYVGAVLLAALRFSMRIQQNHHTVKQVSDNNPSFFVYLGIKNADRCQRCERHSLYAIVIINRLLGAVPGDKFGGCDDYRFFDNNLCKIFVPGDKHIHIFYNGCVQNRIVILIADIK